MAGSISNLVQRLDPFKGNRGLFRSGGKMNEQTGFAIVVFRKGKLEFFFEEGAGNVHLENGDELIQVNMGHEELAWDGKITSKEGLAMNYRAIVPIRVCDPRLVATLFRQYGYNADNLVQHIQGALHAAIASGANHDLHDELDEVGLRVYINAKRSYIARTYGILLDEDGTISIDIDPNPEKVELRRVRFEEKINTIRALSQVERDEFTTRLRRYYQGGATIEQIVRDDEDMAYFLLEKEENPRKRRRIEQLIEQRESQKVIDSHASFEDLD